MGRGAWRVTVHGAAKSDTTEQLSTAQAYRRQGGSLSLQLGLWHIFDKCQFSTREGGMQGPGLPCPSQGGVVWECVWLLAGRCSWLGRLAQ